MFNLYSFFTFFFYPVFVVLIFLRKFINKEDRKRYKEKLFSSNFNVKKNNNKLIWFHAASIGEAQSIIPLVKKITKLQKNTNVLITTISLTSSNLVNKEFKDNYQVEHRFFPLDVKFLIKKFLSDWKPSIAIFIDSEIWPNFLLEINKKKIPLILLNGRITKKTFLRWNLISNTARKIFALFDLCLVANFDSEKYLKTLGAKNIKNLGNLKFASENKSSKALQIKNENSKNKKFWCAVSTHRGEESFIINAHLNLKRNGKNFICIIIPRHIARIKEISNICKNKNLNFQILSDKDLIDEKSDIIIVNSYGHVPKYLKLCKSVFIGKSLLKKLEAVGGQNPIEAAKFGCKIYHGPYVYNFKDIYQQLSKYKITEKVSDDVDLSNKISFDLNNQNGVINQNVIKDINELGNKILNKTFDEIKKFD